METITKVLTGKRNLDNKELATIILTTTDYEAHIDVLKEEVNNYSKEDLETIVRDTEDLEYLTIIFLQFSDPIFTHITRTDYGFYLSTKPVENQLGSIKQIQGFDDILDCLEKDRSYYIHRESVQLFYK